MLGLYSETLALPRVHRKCGAPLTGIMNGKVRNKTYVKMSLKMGDHMSRVFLLNQPSFLRVTSTKLYFGKPLDAFPKLVGTRFCAFSRTCLRGERH